jgi:hypothetical protein
MATVVPTPAQPAKFPFGLRIFEPAPPAPVMLTDATAIQQSYRTWQWNVLFSSIIGYATFYFVRKNLSTAMPIMEKELGISKIELGAFLCRRFTVCRSLETDFSPTHRCARAFMVVGPSL